MATGTVQLPPNGFPIVLVVECQSTGGYPILGTIASIDIPRLAQLRPGQTLQFTILDIAKAQSLLRESQQSLLNLSAWISQRLEEMRFP